MSDCGRTCNTTLTFVSFTPRVVARVRALFGLRVALGEAGTLLATASASEAVLLGLRLDMLLALPGLTLEALPGEVVLAKSGPKAKVWCFCAALGVAMVPHAGYSSTSFKLASRRKALKQTTASVVPGQLTAQPSTRAQRCHDGTLQALQAKPSELTSR